MNVIIIGGTGLIGYHATLELLARGHSVTAVSRGSIKLAGWYPKEVKVITGDVFEMEEASLSQMFTGFDAMVYAIGPDDQKINRKPAYAYFHEKLVVQCEKICQNAKNAGIARIVILSSYFHYLDRTNPSWHLAKHHPYIDCRKQQAKRCLQLADSGLGVIILEIPYVFGTMPNRTPLWKEQLVARIDYFIPFIFFTTGGTAMVTAKYCGEAVRGALEQGKTGKYLIGDVNMSWKEMLAIASRALYGNQRKVIVIPNFLARLYGINQKFKHKLKGKEAGLNYSKFIGDIQSKYTYIPEEVSKKSAQDLNLTRGNVRSAMKDTFIHC